MAAIKGSHLKRVFRSMSQERYFMELLPSCLMSAAGPLPIEISLVFVNDKTIREMNLRYRGKDKVTDVLSFPMYEFDLTNKAVFDHDKILLGDIVISVPQALRQAEERTITLEEEVLRLAIHGMLHLLGYDHEKDKKAAATMRRLENRLLLTQTVHLKKPQSADCRVKKTLAFQ